MMAAGPGRVGWWGGESLVATILRWFTQKVSRNPQLNNRCQTPWRRNQMLLGKYCWDNYFVESKNIKCSIVLWF